MAGLGRALNSQGIGRSLLAHWNTPPADGQEGLSLPYGRQESEIIMSGHPATHHGFSLWGLHTLFFANRLSASRKSLSLVRIYILRAHQSKRNRIFLSSSNFEILVKALIALFFWITYPSPGPITVTRGSDVDWLAALTWMAELDQRKSSLSPKRWLRETGMALGKSWDHHPDVYLQQWWYLCFHVYSLLLGVRSIYW